MKLEYLVAAGIVFIFAVTLTFGILYHKKKKPLLFAPSALICAVLVFSAAMTGTRALMLGKESIDRMLFAALLLALLPSLVATLCVCAGKLWAAAASGAIITAVGLCVYDAGFKAPHALTFIAAGEYLAAIAVCAAVFGYIRLPAAVSRIFPWNRLRAKKTVNGGVLSGGNEPAKKSAAVNRGKKIMRARRTISGNASGKINAAKKTAKKRSKKGKG